MLSKPRFRSDRWEPNRFKTAPPPPHIYVASLTDHHAGRLHGVWLDATQPVERMRAAIVDMLAASPAGNAHHWAILDSVGFTGVRIGAHEPLERVAALARRIANAAC